MERGLVGVLALAAHVCAAACGNRTTAAPREWTEPVTGMRFVRIDPATFRMGTPESEPGREAQERLHQVSLTRAYYLAATEITERQWTAIMGTNPSHFAGCNDCPVERVSFLDVAAFLARLRARTGTDARLPTEAEWEYACRAGSDAAFGSGRATLSTDEANVNGTFPYDGRVAGIYREQTTRVASFRANGFGLFDMNGNVWEWTADRHCPYPDGPVTDPLGTCADEFMVIRGGSWYFDAASARCGLRYTHRPQDSGFSLGARVALSKLPD